MRTMLVNGTGTGTDTETGAAAGDASLPQPTPDPSSAIRQAEIKKITKHFMAQEAGRLPPSSGTVSKKRVVLDDSAIGLAGQPHC